TGPRTSTAFPLTPGFLKTHLQDSSDAFVTKLGPSGTLVYSTYIGGSGVDAGSAIDIDTAGAAYVTGSTKSTDFPLVNAYYGSSVNAFSYVLKLNATATSLVYSTYIEKAQGQQVAVDQVGAAYVAGLVGSW